MGILITIGIIIASLVALILIIALFIKKDYSVKREVIINRSKGEVFSYIKSLKNQDTYSKWAQMDPAMKKEYTGTDGTVGFVSAWDSNKKNVGKGTQTITAIREGEQVDFGLHFIKPFEGKADAYMRTTDQGANQTGVEWGLKSKMAYPMNFMLLFMNMEKMIGNDLETGLSNLKSQLEK